MNRSVIETIRRVTRTACVLAFLAVPIEARAQLIVPAQGWDGSLSVTANATIDLSAAATGDWATQPADPGWSPGDGVYDPSQWAVVFHYTDVTIGAGKTLTFLNHPAGAPVVWLVSGNVTVAGTIGLDGEVGGTDGYPAEGGPGGFRGGNGTNLGIPIGGGFGPGGALAVANHDGSYATQGTGGAPTYGNESIVPLIGGSGGAGSYASGGGGGGAILIAAAGVVQVNGEIHANGEISVASQGGRGSGGAIRLVAEDILGAGSLLAIGGDAGAGEGRIRLETVNQPPSVSQVFPAASIASLSPGSTVKIWPEVADPALRVVSLNGVAVPADPEATLSFPWEDVALNGGAGDVTVQLEGTNVPANASVNVFLTHLGGERLAPQPASFVSSAGNLSTWEITLNGVNNGISAIQARAVLP